MAGETKCLCQLLFIIMKYGGNTQQVVRFCIVGMLNAIITYVSLFILDRMGVRLLWANFFGYFIVLIHSFVWSRAWIFKKSSRKLISEFLLFTSTFLIAFALQFTVFSLLVKVADINEYIANLAGLIVFGATNFIVNKKVTFRQ